MGMCVSKVDKTTKANKLRVIVSSEKDKSIVSEELSITRVGLSSQRLQPHLVSTMRNQDSKEETFFDSQPWLNSDSEDDFVSVNGDFTPSRGSTPVHPSFSHKSSSLNKSISDEKSLGFNSEQSPAGKKRSLVELFRDSIRISIDHADTNEQKVWPKKNETVTNEDAKIIEKKETKNVQCCIPRMLSGRRSCDGNKKTCSPPAFRTL